MPKKTKPPAKRQYEEDPGVPASPLDFRATVAALLQAKPVAAPPKKKPAPKKRSGKRR